MAPEYYGEDDMGSSSIFPSKSANLCVKMVMGDRTAGLCLMQAGSSRAQHGYGYGTQPGDRAAQRGRLSQQIASFISSLIPTWDGVGKKSPCSLAP